MSHCADETEMLFLPYRSFFILQIFVSTIWSHSFGWGAREGKKAESIQALGKLWIYQEKCARSHTAQFCCQENGPLLQKCGSSESLWEMQGPIPDLLNKNLHFKWMPRKFQAQRSLRPTDLDSWSSRSLGETDYRALHDSSQENIHAGVCLWRITGLWLDTEGSGDSNFPLPRC